MDEIRRLTRVILGPETDGRHFIEVRCYCSFEGHGRASETWEEHWEINLPCMPYFWRSNTGWRRGLGDAVGMRFHGRTWGDVEAAAVGFLRWYADLHG